MEIKMFFRPLNSDDVYLVNEERPVVVLRSGPLTPEMYDLDTLFEKYTFPACECLGMKNVWAMNSRFEWMRVSVMSAPRGYAPVTKGNPNGP